MTVLRYLRKLNSHYSCYSRFISASCNRIPTVFASTDASFVNDLEKAKFTKKFPLKKRSFTDDEQKSTFGKLVYYSPVHKVVYWCKLLSLSTSISTSMITPYMLWRMQELHDQTGAVVWTVLSTLFLFTPLILDRFTRRLVLEVYYNSDKDQYTAIYLNVFLKKRALTFRLDDVKPAKPETAFLITHTVGKNLMLLYRQGYRDEQTRVAFESMLDFMDQVEDKIVDDDDNDEPAKATMDHHKRQQDQ